MLGRPTDPRPLLLLCALAGCGSGSTALTAPNDAANESGPVASGSDAAAPDGNANLLPDAPLNLLPDAPANLLPDAPAFDAPHTGETGSAFPACVLNADCPEPLVCALGLCHLGCISARDCPSDRRCARVSGSDVCLRPEEDRCTRNADCPPILLCAPDLRCRNQCKQPGDCKGAEPICTNGYCAASQAVDGGLDSGADASSDGPMMLWGLSRGTNLYRITDVASVSDGCAIDPGALLQLTLPVTYDEATSVISIGNPQGTPPMPALGSGKVGANMATLLRENDQTTGATLNCIYHRRNVAYFRLFYHDKFTLDATEEESLFSTGCTDVPAGGRCQSSWRWTFEKAN
jgi:hypothetical protein